MTAIPLRHVTWLRLLLAGGLPLATVLACGGGGSSSSPTELAAVGITLDRATVSVDGTSYNGGTYHMGQGPGASTRFEAHLRFYDGQPAPGQAVWVDSDHGHGMMGDTHFQLFDDGTHGDPFAGDGVYCYEDFAGDYGFHQHDAMHGEYHFDFWGEQHDGHTSNHMQVMVQVED